MFGGNFTVKSFSTCEPQQLTFTMLATKRRYEKRLFGFCFIRYCL